MSFFFGYPAGSIPKCTDHTKKQLSTICSHVIPMLATAWFYGDRCGNIMQNSLGLTPPKHPYLPRKYVSCKFVVQPWAHRRRGCTHFGDAQCLTAAEYSVEKRAHFADTVLHSYDGRFTECNRTGFIANSRFGHCLHWIFKFHIAVCCWFIPLQNSTIGCLCASYSFNITRRVHWRHFVILQQQHPLKPYPTPWLLSKPLPYASMIPIADHLHRLLVWFYIRAVVWFHTAGYICRWLVIPCTLVCWGTQT